VPQLFESVIVFEHTAVPPLLHNVSPVAHTHTLDMQLDIAGQTLPQPPQLVLSEVVFTHVPGLPPPAPHTLSPVGHEQ
jgi:hypothetical protein